MNSFCGVNWQLALEYVKVLTNWQLLTFIGCIVGGTVFKPQFGRLIDRVAKIKGLGFEADTATAQAQANSAQPIDSELPEAAAKSSALAGVGGLSIAPNEKLVGVLDEVESPASFAGDSAPSQSGQLTQADFNKLVTKMETERTFSKIWEFRYMNFYFAVATQAILNWLVQVDKLITEEQYTAIWLNRINRPEERRAILQALENHGCIEIDGGYISVTVKGKEYHTFVERRVIHIEAYYPKLPDVKSFDYSTVMGQVTEKRVAG